MYIITTATDKLSKLKRRVRGIAGGTSAGKTISILQLLIDRAQRDKRPTLTSVVSETMPHLKKGAIRDFLSILIECGYFRDDRWNKTDSIYTFETGSKIEFFSAEESDKVRGPRRDRLFMNEASNIPFETFEQLEIRTKEVIWLDWNPVSEFWWYTEVMPMREVDFMILTYKDNEGLDKAIVDSIESRKGNKNWWRVYGEGLLGEAEGRIYKDWAMVDLPHEARLRRYGLDFGYTNDPTAIVGIYEYNGGYVLDEVAYQKGLSNKDIADLFKNQPKALIIADSAEPKSIAELKLYGLNILPAQKGKGSILQGISFVQDQRISVTKQSTNILKEYRNYLWLTDRVSGKTINEPQDFLNHSMDAIRYGLDTFRKSTGKVNYDVGGVKPYYDGVDGQSPKSGLEVEIRRNMSVGGVDFDY
jgi:phage terminase large subunit